MDSNKQNPQFDKQVEFMVEMYKGWLVNMQKDAYAQGEAISAEVIAQAFSELRDYYDILWQEYDLDEQYRKLLGE